MRVLPRNNILKWTVCISLTLCVLALGTFFWIIHIVHRAVYETLDAVFKEISTPVVEHVGHSIGQPFYLWGITEAFHRENGRWPSDFTELNDFWETRKSRTGDACVEGIDLTVFTDVTFTPLPDGSVKLNYSMESSQLDLDLPLKDGAGHISVKGKCSVRSSDSSSGTMTISRPSGEPCP